MLFAPQGALRLVQAPSSHARRYAIRSGTEAGGAAAAQAVAVPLLLDIEAYPLRQVAEPPS